MSIKNQAQGAQTESPAFFDKPKNVNILMYSFYGLSVVLVALDFFIHRHELKLVDGNMIKMLEQLPTFYAVYGFVGCSLLVFGAKIMRVFLMRNEDYYDNRNDEDYYVNNPPTRIDASSHADAATDTTQEDVK